MSTKRELSGDGDEETSGSKRRKKRLRIKEKVELLKQLEAGTSVKHLSETYDVGINTIYGIKKQKSELCKFYSDCDTTQMETRKSMHGSRCGVLDATLIQWFHVQRSKGISISDQMLIEQAKMFHAELKLFYDCDFSLQWLHKFKKRHGISVFKVGSAKLSDCTQAAKDFVFEFAEYVSGNNLTAEQVYNADETALHWRCMSRSTLCTTDNPDSRMKNSKRATVLACSNAAGTHKMKLLVVGERLQPSALRGVEALPVEYQASKKAWLTCKIRTEWFESFVRQSRQHCNKIGLDPHCKIVLVLDNCFMHTPVENLQGENVSAMFLPPNCSPLIQPQDQGILRSLKCRYHKEFMSSFLSDLNSGKTVAEIKTAYTIKDMIWALARIWESMPISTLHEAWYKLWPTLVHRDMADDSNVENDPDLKGLEKQNVNKMLKYAKCATNRELTDLELREENITEWFEDDENVPVVHNLSDEEILNSVTNTDIEEDKSGQTSDG